MLNKYYEIEKKDAQEVGYFPDSLSEYRVSHICMLYILPIQEFIEHIKYTVNILLKQEQQLKKLPSYLHTRYKELLIAVNNNMPLSFFWLAGSIIEGILGEYCKKNNIKSSKDDVDGYITALENNKKITKGSTIYTTLQHFRQFRNTIHPNNVNNDFIQDKNLQIREEELNDVIKFFSKLEKIK